MPQVESSIQVYRLNFCMGFSLAPFVLHVMPISESFILSCFQAKTKRIQPILWELCYIFIQQESRTLCIANVSDAGDLSLWVTEAASWSSSSSKLVPWTRLMTVLAAFMVRSLWTLSFDQPLWLLENQIFSELIKHIYAGKIVKTESLWSHLVIRIQDRTRI
jgi:hypothetical protein